MHKELCFSSATELAVEIKRRNLSPVELVDAYLQRIAERNDAINAYVTVISEQAREQARLAEQELMDGKELGPLHGVPIAIKDLEHKAGVRTTFGSKPLKGFVPDENTTFLDRLEGAGAVVLGKTNTPEFGHKGATDNLLFGPTSTPFAPGKNAGGSSGGSAAAVADGLAALAQGGDGGGSIRIPAAFCGVYGFKPSWGRVATKTRPNAFTMYAPHFVHYGPLTRTVEDAALMLDVMVGPHPRDPFSLPKDSTQFLASTQGSADNLKIAYSPDLGGFPVDQRIASTIERAVGTLDHAGLSVHVVDVNLKHSHHDFGRAWLALAGVTYADTFEQIQKEQGIDLFVDHRDQISPELIQLVQDGRTLSALEYRRYDQLRTDALDAVQDVLEEYDVLIAPVTGALPFDNVSGGNTLGPSEINGEEIDPHFGWILTHLINFTGHPAASLPAGFTDEGLPVGMQIIGRRFDDAAVLAASALFERMQPWRDEYPGLRSEPKPGRAR